MHVMTNYKCNDGPSGCKCSFPGAPPPEDVYCAVHAQMISSISGAVLDTFTLTKPANFKPDLAGRTAFLKSFKQTYFPGQNYPASIRYIEQTGRHTILLMQ